MIDSLAESLVEVYTPADALIDRWHQAAGDAAAAYAEWQRRRDPESYAAYRACADRADAAQDELARLLVT
jgi:hypothetical protein